jgi:hypothetical protein
MSARKAENGFVTGRIVSSDASRRNIRGEKANHFKTWNILVARIAASRNESDRDFWHWIIV